MRFKIFNLALLVGVCFLNWSCALFHPDKVKKDEGGYYLRHYWSCGPRALNKAFKEFDIFLGEKKISQEIQDSGNTTRHLLSLIHYDTIQITLPSEILSVIKKHGFKVIKVTELRQLNPRVDLALILVTGSYIRGEAHWLCFPVDNNIKKFFGEETRVSKIFLLKKID